MSLSPVGQAFAPMLIGAFGNAILLGISAVQTLVYFQSYKRDPWWFKCLVAYLMVAGVVNTASDIALVYEPLILRYGSTTPTTPKFLPADSAVTALVSTPVQIFMAWRIKVMSKSLIITLIVVICSLASLAGGLWLSSGVITHSFFKQDGSLPDAAILWLFSSAATDILITGTIVFILARKRRMHRRSMDSSLNSYVNRVIRQSVQSGALTTTAVLADVIVFLILPNTSYFFIWDLMLAKLYTISLLTSLNARPITPDTGTARPREQNALFPHDSTASPSATLPISSKSDSANSPEMTFTSIEMLTTVTSPSTSLTSPAVRSQSPGPGLGLGSLPHTQPEVPDIAQHNGMANSADIGVIGAGVAVSNRNRSESAALRSPDESSTLSHSHGYNYNHRHSQHHASNADSSYWATPRDEEDDIHYRYAMTSASSDSEGTLPNWNRRRSVSVARGHAEVPGTPLMLEAAMAMDSRRQIKF